MGTITVDAPAPSPDKKRPIENTAMEPDKASRLAPSTKNRAVRRMASSLPCFEDSGPAKRAPMKPPTTNMEFKAANSVSLIGMHGGSFRSEITTSLAAGW